MKNSTKIQNIEIKIDLFHNEMVSFMEDGDEAKSQQMLDNIILLQNQINKLKSEKKQGRNIKITPKIQKQSISKTGSFVNFLMGNNSALPVVGKGATKLMWSDRHAYEVVWVNENRSECIIQEYIKKRIDKNGMSESQAYEYKELDGLDRKVVWRNKQGGKWCFEVKEINFIPKWIKEVHEKTGNFAYAKSLSTVDYKEIYFKNGEHSQNPIKVVKGITKEYTRYYPVNILFGVKESYYDFTF